METETDLNQDLNQDKFVPVCIDYRTFGFSKYLKQMIQASYLYEINRNGVVRNIKTKHVMTWHRMAKKYKRYKLKPNRQWNIMYHRLLMLTFHPIANPDGMDVEHIKDEVDSDGFKSNALKNLKWMTQKDHRGQKRKRFYSNTGQKKPVEQYDLVSGKTLETYNSTIEAAKFLGIDNKNLIAVCKNRRTKSGGYGWRYTPAFLKSQQTKQGERWKSFHNKVISIFGRVKAEKASLISYGNLRQGTNAYRSFNYNDGNNKHVEKRVHQVVLHLFGQDKIKAFEKKHPGLTWTPDHIDGNGEHNCIANLRPASRSQQMKNRYNKTATSCNYCDFYD